MEMTSLGEIILSMCFEILMLVSGDGQQGKSDARVMSDIQFVQCNLKQAFGLGDI